METILHIAVLYVFLLACFRLMGKRELAQMSPFELVTLMMIPEIVSQALNRDDHSMTNAMLGISTLFLLVVATSLLKHRFEKFERVVDSAPTLLVAEGKILERNMNEERISPEDLYAEMHKAGLSRVKDVRWAVLESGGHITIIAKDRAQRTTEPQMEGDTELA
jgi:uncharacterized membrane protein YcaP (DUF421 family)